MIYVVILAGGAGSRVNKVIPKQHLLVKGKQLIEYTIQSFLNYEAIDDIVIVSNEFFIDEMLLMKSKYRKIKKVIVGGKTRIESVYRAVIDLANYANDNDKIIISDAARPLITKQELHKLIEKLNYNRAATTYKKLNETILKVNNGEAYDVLYREGCLRQTSPEAYQFSVLRELYLFSNKETIHTYTNVGVDQLLKVGEKVGLVETNPFNYKITDEKDIEVFKGFLSYGFENIINLSY